MKKLTLFSFISLLSVFLVSCNNIRLCTDITKYDANKENGYYTSYSDSAGLITNSRYKNGLKEGVEFIVNKNGTITSINKYKGGHKHGWCRTYSNGQISSEIKYKNGKVQKVRIINISW